MKTCIKLITLITCISLLVSCSVLASGNKDAEGVKMTAKIVSIGERIEVEVIEGEYGATGPYWVITSSETTYLDKNENVVSRSSLSVGDTVEIVYSGQVMMSYPPQIVALKIRIK